jgi:predicted small metal-binding protein
MKQVTCAQLGGPADCHAMLSGETASDVISSGWKHIEQAHPDLAKNIMSNPKEVNDQWMADFTNRFDDIPDV